MAQSFAPSGTSKQEVLEAYLREQIQAGNCYFKSRFIAEEMELSASEIGAAISRLQQTSEHLEIEQWSYTNGTTWRIALAESEQ